MSQPTTAACSRRRFLTSAAGVGGAAAAAPYFLTSAALGGEGKVPASERITVGFIGVGGHGVGRNLTMFLSQPDAEPVALCDVDRRRLDVALKHVRQRRGAEFTGQTTQDWREVVARDDVDAVMISTPDHWHVPISLAALRAGKDVICEKPTRTIEEGQALRDTVRQYGAVFQLSTEDRSLSMYHRMAELVRNGRLGKLQRIYVGLPSAPAESGDPTPQPAPPELDWDMWLGPAPWSPYRPGVHPFNWRWVSDYSGGILPDWGAHLLDTAQWANDTEHTGPVEIEGAGRRHANGLYDTFYEFRLTFRYANGVELHVKSGEVALKFEGAKGWVGNTGWRGKVEASTEAILNSRIEPEETHLFTCPAGEHRNFLDCVKSRRDPYFPADIGHRCCTLCHLGVIALELGRPLKWDPEKEQFLDDEAANRMRSRAMRAPWRL